MVTGRFAPSPSGRLHLGNLRTALVAWLSVRSADGTFRLRVDDLDPATASRRHESDQLDDLAALGIDWDGPVLRQSTRAAAHAEALRSLERAGLTYRCWCSRRDIREAVTAPHLPLGAYPGTCAQLSADEVRERERSGRPAALRLRAAGTEVTVTDRLHGAVTATLDDFVVRRNDGLPGYHLTVVVDDAHLAVDEVVRGDDLLDSTPRHAHLADVLGLDRPAWAHVPLALNSVGDRLAKRDGAVTLGDRFALGESTDDVVGAMARSLGIDTGPTDAAALVDGFSLDVIDRSPWVLDPAILGADD